MANSTEEGNYETDFLQRLIPYVCIGLLSLSGLPIQSFIVAVNVIDWMKGRAITGADKIITSIGITRIFHHTAYLIYIIPQMYFPRLQKIIIIVNTSILRTSHFASIWLSMLLSFFFYFNISTSQNIVFLHLKATISRRVTYLIIASVLFSVAQMSVFYFGISDFSEKIISHVHIMWTSIPHLLIFVASLLLIILLAFHLSRMKTRKNMTSSTEPYYRTINFTVVSFLFCAMYMLEHLSKLGIPNLVYSWLFVLVNIFPVLHSVLLIYVVTKLRNQFFRVVHCGNNFLCNRSAPGPQSREPEEVTRL